MTALPKNGKAYSTGETPVFIISAELTTNGVEQNKRLTSELEASLVSAFYCDHPRVKRIKGSYKGVEEDSFIVNGDRETILELAAYYGQESVLHIDTSRRATLIYLVPLHGIYPEEHIGTFVNVTKEEALACDAWTYDKSQDEYYIVK